MLQNSKCKLCGYRDETINHIISECSKLAQKEYKWYMHKPESVFENQTHKILRVFEIQTDHLIPARRPDLVIVNNNNNNKKGNLPNIKLWPPCGSLSENQRKWKERLARELKMLYNLKVTVILIVIGVPETILKGLIKGLEELEIGGRVETI